MSFQKKRGTDHIRCPNIKDKYGNVQNAFTKEGAGVSLFFFFFVFCLGGGGGGGGGVDCFSPEQVY